MYYTLEVSRTASGALAGWATLKYFGKEGMQAILGGILESKYYLYDLLGAHPDMVCVNPDDSGLSRCFGPTPEESTPGPSSAGSWTSRRVAWTC